MMGEKKNLTKESLQDNDYFFNLEQRKSVWPVEARRSMKFGRAARLMMEIAHPQVAIAINDHASFTFDRLERTVLGNVEIIFGSKKTALERARVVNRAHQVKSRNEAGEKYTANDPGLKGFVFDMRILATIIAHENFVAKLTQEQKDAYVSGIKPYGNLMGVSERNSSNTWQDIVDRYSLWLKNGQIKIGEEAKSVANKLIEPLDDFQEVFKHLVGDGILSGLLGTSASNIFNISTANKIHSLVTRGLLPPEMRESYGFEWSDEDEKMFKAFTYSVRLSNACLPNKITHIPEFNGKAL